MSYWRGGDPVSNMQTENGVPTCFTWQGRVHNVSAVAKMWRIDDGWWVQRVWQDYFKLITSTGLLVILSHDLLTGEWRLLRIYD